jgi:maltose alpha-D-glucosyltransferase/alpha-amylase
VSAFLETAVFYQVYPQSFCDSNGDGVGDLPGLISKLDYIRSLGCNAIWLNPIFSSPFGDAGYDITDFCSVAPRYGTNDDLRRLLAEAHRRGMRVCLDLVAGHTSVEHPWFRDSALAERNRHSDWYVWMPPDERNDSAVPCPGDGSRKDKYLPNYYPFQPALNYGYAHPDPNKPWQRPVTDPACRAVREELRRIMEFWLERGVDGFRVDMASSLIRGDPDGEGIRALWRDYRSWFSEHYPEAVLISEWSHPAKAIPAGFDIDFMIHFGESAYIELVSPNAKIDGGTRIPSAFFERAGQGDIRAFLDSYLRNYEPTKAIGHIALPTANHDFPRPRWGRSEAEVRVLFAMLLTMPGVPFIYYGDEIGMRYVAGTPDREGGEVRCGSRTPMQWTGGRNAGFSTAAPDKLYLPIDPEENRPDVESQEKDPASLLNFTRALLELRREHPALANGSDFKPLYAESKTYPFVYLRTDGREKILVAVNPSDREYAIALAAMEGARVLLAQGAAGDDGRLVMKPVSFGIFAAAQGAEMAEACGAAGK